MDSLEEDMLVQMAHDFIESEPSTPTIFPTSLSNCLSINQAKFFTLQEILGRVTDAEAKVLDTVLKHTRNRNDAEKTTILKKLLVKRLKTDGFNASICQTSWVASLGCPAGDYEYIEITLKDQKKDGDTMRLIVDIDFRSQFELARSTPSYKQLTDALPSFFVGTEEKLNKIISLLCSAAKQSLRDRGLHVPPWRTSTYMQSKWLSGCRKVITNGCGSRENREATNGLHHGGYGSMWAPPMVMVKPKRRDLGGGESGLSSQFSSMGINCC